MRVLSVATIALATSLAVSAAACRSTSEPSNNVVADSVHLAYGVRTPVTGAPITLTFEELVGDTRCPPDLLCTAAGELAVGIRIERESPGGEAVEVLTVPGATSHVVFGYRFELFAAVSRRASTEAPLPVADYWIALRVLRVPD